jgi:enoyl-CoA hydratase
MSQQENGEEVLITIDGTAGRLSLNRPKAIHALTLGMVRAMTDALLKWREDDAVHAVILDHAEGRGLCAGGDIAILRASILNDGGVTGRAFFREEYQLNHLMHEYAKPIVSFMDGIVMGGGVGIAQPAQFRVATENTRFAMPETGIGLFPDVGGGWYLPRLPGRSGVFLGLTGARLDGAECMALGLTTHYMPVDALTKVKARIAAGEAPEGVLGALAITPPEARIMRNMERIKTHFASDRLEDILASLNASDDPWAAKELATLNTKSPLSCKVALRQLALGAQAATFADNMAQEFRIASRMLTRPDFAEGIRAVIVDKTGDPTWTPATPQEVDDALVDSILAPLPPEDEWTPL